MAFVRWVLLFIVVFASYFAGTKYSYAEWTFDADNPVGTITVRCQATGLTRTYPIPDDPSTGFSCASGNMDVTFNCTDNTAPGATVQEPAL